VSGAETPAGQIKLDGLEHYAINARKKEMPEPLSKEFLLSRGKCCGGQCTNCPYTPRWKKGSTQTK
jgi:hypothetical protein